LRTTLVLIIEFLLFGLIAQLSAAQSGAEIILRSVERTQASATIQISLKNITRSAIYLETTGGTKSATLHSVFVECRRNSKWLPAWPFTDLPPSGIMELKGGLSVEHSIVLPVPLPSPGHGISPLPQGKCRVKARFFRSENQWHRFMSDIHSQSQPEIIVSELFAFPRNSRKTQE